MSGHTHDHGPGCNHTHGGEALRPSRPKPPVGLNPRDAQTGVPQPEAADDPNAVRTIGRLGKKKG